MNELIKAELNKVKVANLPDEYEDCSTIIISKGTREVSMISLSIGRYYHVELAKIVVESPPHFMLHQQWNQGISPKECELNIQVLDILNDMVKIHGVGVTTNSVWEGWVPQNLIRVISLIE